MMANLSVWENPQVVLELRFSATKNHVDLQNHIMSIYAHYSQGPTAKFYQLQQAGDIIF